MILVACTFLDPPVDGRRHLRRGFFDADTGTFYCEQTQHTCSIVTGAGVSMTVNCSIDKFAADLLDAAAAAIEDDPDEGTHRAN